MFSLTNNSFLIPEVTFDKFRIEFYSLFIGNWNFKIADLGDLPNGKEIEDSYFMVNKISIDLRKLNIIPIFIGGSQDLTSSIYKSFEKNNQWIISLHIFWLWMMMMELDH